MASLGTLAVNLNANSRNFVSGMAAAENAINSFAIKAGAIALVMKGFEGLTGAVRLAAGFQLVSTQLEVLTGSASAAKKMIDELYQLGLESPFGAQDFLDSAKILGQFGVSLSKTTELVRIIGDVALGDADKFYRMSIAFGQMSASGRLMGQDLLQMVNAGMNPLFYISQRTGESLQQLRFRMEAGKITVREVTQAFKDATAEGGRFYGATQKINQTLMGQWLEFKENLEAIGRVIGGFLLPGLTKLLFVFNDLIKNMLKTESATAKAIATFLGFSAIAVVISMVTKAIIDMTMAIYAARVAVLRFSAASVVGWISLIISILATIFLYKYFSNTLDEATDASEELKREQDRLNELLGMGGSTVEAWSQHWIDAAEALVAAGIATRDTTEIVQLLSNASGGNVMVFEAMINAFATAHRTGSILGQDLRTIEDELKKTGSGISIMRILARQLSMTFVELGQHILDGELSLDQFKDAMAETARQAAVFNTAAMFGATLVDLSNPATATYKTYLSTTDIQQSMIDGQKALEAAGSQVNAFEVMQQQLSLNAQQLNQSLAAGTITLQQYINTIDEVINQRQALGEMGDIVPDLEIKSKGLEEAEKLLEKIRLDSLSAAEANLELMRALDKTLWLEAGMGKRDRTKVMDDYAKMLTGYNDKLREAQDQQRILNGETERQIELQRMLDTGVPVADVEALRILHEQNDALRAANELKAKAWKPEVAGAAVKGSAEAHTLKVQNFLRNTGQGQQAVWVAIKQNGAQANKHLAKIAKRPPQVEFIAIGPVGGAVA